MRVLQDVRFGFRSLVKNPGLTLVALAALALGIGVNATVFTLTNAVLFKGLPFDKGDRILYFLTRNVRDDRLSGVSYPDLRDWRAGAKSFDGLAAATGQQTNLADDNAPEVYPTTPLSANSFRLIGQKPVIGRDFSEADEASGAPPVVILTYGLWERRYGKDPAVVGRVVRMNGVPTTIIGVMPRDFAFPNNADLWVPLVPTPDSEKRELRNLIVFGRLREGATLLTARAEMDTISRNLERAYPATNQSFTASVRTYQEQVIGPQIRIIFTAMFVAVGFVLLIACANVANLQLARAVKRSREISIRVALGATRGTIIQQLLVESVTLSAAGGVLGWLIAIWGIRLFDVVITPLGKPRWIEFTMDARVIVYLMAISIGTGVLFGLAPARRLAKLDVTMALKDGGRGASIGIRGKHLASLLAIVEMALAVVLLAGAGLMVRSFLNIYRASLGINSSNVLTLRVQLPPGKYKGPDDQVAFHDRLTARLASLPGVESVAFGTTLPTGGSMTLPYEFQDAPPVDAQHRPTLSAVVVGPDYFRVWDVRVWRGRFFGDTDTASSVPVALVNEAFAGKFWPGQDPLTKRLRVFTGSTPGPWLTVVGTVGNIVHNDIASRQIDPVIYLPFRQKPMPGVAVMARTRVPPGTLAMAFRRELEAVDANVPIFNLWTMEERLQRNYLFQEVIGSVFVIFAGIALLLASVGLYAVIANSVNQRTQEIGVRMAVGATARNILQLVFAQGMRQMAIGLAIGLMGAFAMTRVLKSVLIQVSPSDPGAFVAASLALALAAAMGCLIPARRAMSVEPVVALYHE
jgi:putative ABC transport system permease protein